MPAMNLFISHRSIPHVLSVLPETTIESLQAQLEALTLVPPSHQKLLYKGKKTLQEGFTIVNAGLRDGSKIQLLGPTRDEVVGLRNVEDEQAKRNKIMKERALKAPVKLRSTAKAGDASTNYTFRSIQPLPNLPDIEAARAVLQKLSDDPAVQHVMRKHKFAVGLLTELAPRPDLEREGMLLGLNKNAGETILLRIRTDTYKGFRNYRDIRRVAMHELTHNVWGDHDDNFKELNSRLNREIVEFERAAADGTHYLGDIDDRTEVYMPPAHLEAAEARGQTLGGAGSSGQEDSLEERRRRMLDATMKRRQEESQDN